MFAEEDTEGELGGIRSKKLGRQWKRPAGLVCRFSRQFLIFAYNQCKLGRFEQVFRKKGKSCRMTTIQII